MPSARKAPKPFAHYARYYDLLYGNKDYAAEARFVHGRLRAGGKPRGRLLELGCGTGRHAIAMSRFGWNVDGYDLSRRMVARARRQPAPAGRKPRFAVGDMVSLRNGRTYDAVVSLFHVLGYQTTDRKLAGSLRTAAAHLPPGGLFLFDFWYGPAVLAERPSVRTKRVEDDRIAVTRVATPTLDAARHLVTVKFDVAVEVKSTGRIHRIREKHPVRYFFLPELKEQLAAAGFEVRSHGRWMNQGRLDARSWYGWLLARRTAEAAAPAIRRK